MKKIKIILSAVVAAGVWISPCALAENIIQDVKAIKQGEDVILRVQMKDALVQPPKGFSVANPPRLAFDFPDTAKAEDLAAQQKLSVGDLIGLNLVPSGGRVRLVLNLVRNLNHEVRLDGNAVLLTLKPVATASSTAGSFKEGGAVTAAKPAIRDITFRRGKDGEGRVVIDFGAAGAAADVKQQGSNVIVEMPTVTLPEHLRRKLDVTDFATPVVGVVAAPSGEGTRITITPKGLWEHNAYQTDQQLVIEVKPVIEDPNKLAQGSRLGYQGPLVSINYANGDVRALLRLMAEELGLDAVISETVTGSLTLVLKDVPADQVMDIIFKQKGLDMRKTGKVILIAPREELALRDKLDFESKQQISELEPLKLETYQLNYQKAVDMARLLSGTPGGGVAPGSTRMLTKRGSVTADNTTNTLFVNDIPSKLDEIRRFIKTIDVSSRQVLIEARVVEANDNFNKDLGVRMSFLNSRPQRLVSGANVEGRSNTGVNVGGGSYSSSGQTSDATFGVNLPISTSTGGAIALSLFNPSLTRILNLELAALESDGRGKVISSPKVVTANNIEALIEDGVEVPYTITQNNNGLITQTVSFKKAKLSLKTTPQITPEGRVRMKLEIAKEEPDWTRAIAGNPPIKSSKVDTDVVVENGGTVVIGGVFTMSNTQTTDRIPFFGDLPYIGFLFKAQTTDSVRRELLVFITPRVINEQLEIK